MLMIILILLEWTDRLEYSLYGRGYMYINYCPSHLSSKWFPYFGKRVELVRPCLVRSQIFPSPRGTSGNCLLLPPPTSGLFSENQMKTFYFPTTQLPINLHSVQWFSMFNHNNKSSYTYTYIQIYTYRDEEIEKNTITPISNGVLYPSTFLALTL